MKMKIVSGIVLMTISSLGFAATEPIKLASDSRIRIVSYSENAVVPIHEMPLTTTQIIFADNQHLVDTQGGDAGGWSPYWDKQVPNVLNIKLTAQISNTNMTIITEDDHQQRFFYYFHLMSVSKEDQSKAVYAVRFVYPAEEAKKLNEKLQKEAAISKALLSAPQLPGKYNWDYSFHGDKSIVPLHVFDDGTFTYLQLQTQQPVPAVFAVDKTDGSESVVNVRKESGYLVIERVAPQLTLRDGTAHVATIFNNKAIYQLTAGE